MNTDEREIPAPVQTWMDASAAGDHAAVLQQAGRRVIKRDANMLTVTA